MIIVFKLEKRKLFVLQIMLYLGVLWHFPLQLEFLCNKGQEEKHNRGIFACRTIHESISGSNVSSIKFCVSDHDYRNASGSVCKQYDVRMAIGWNDHNSYWCCSYFYPGFLQPWSYKCIPSMYDVCYYKSFTSTMPALLEACSAEILFIYLNYCIYRSILLKDVTDLNP